jgi:hypothetical protein
VFEHGEIYNMSSAAILGANFTARWLNIHHSGGDGLKPTGNATVEYSWVHHLGMNDGAHADGVQIRSGSDYVFRYNYFDMPKGLEGFKSNATFLVQCAEGQISNVLIDHNWLNGGSYTVYLKGGPGKGYLEPINVRCTNNLFGRDFSVGPVVRHSGVYWDNNRYWDTNELIK